MTFEEWKSLDGDKVPSTSGFSDKLFEYIKPKGRVLDLGCGYGRIAKLLNGQGYEVMGIDINAAAIEEAKRDPKLSGIEFSVQDAEHTDFDNGVFDAIVEQAVLACMEKPDRELVMKEVSRLLREGGIFSIAEFGIKPADAERYEKDAEIAGEYGTVIVRREDGSEWFRSHNFTKVELDELIKDVDFKVVSYEAVPFKTVKGNFHPGHIYVLRKSEM